MPGHTGALDASDGIDGLPGLLGLEIFLVGGLGLFTGSLTNTPGKQIKPFKEPGLARTASGLVMRLGNLTTTSLTD